MLAGRQPRALNQHAADDAFFGVATTSLWFDSREIDKGKAAALPSHSKYENLPVELQYCAEAESYDGYRRIDSQI